MKRKHRIGLALILLGLSTNQVARHNPIADEYQLVGTFAIIFGVIFFVVGFNMLIGKSK